MRANPICRPRARWNALRPRAERYGPQPISVSRAIFSFFSVFFLFFIGLFGVFIDSFWVFCYLRFSGFAGGFMNFFEHKIFKFEKKIQNCLKSKFVQVGIFKIQNLFIF
jgi:hypothetical protein